MESFSLNCDASTWDLSTAYSLSRMNTLAYLGTAKLLKETKQWGFDHVEIFKEKNAYAFTAERSDAVILTFCGSNDFLDWIKNFDGSVDEEMHRGFNSMCDLIDEPIQHHLEQMLNGRALILTGHSMGAHSASLQRKGWLRWV